MALQNTRQGILFGDLYACLNFNLEEECPNIRIPSLVCTGKQDRFIPPALSRQLAKSIPVAKFEVSGCRTFIAIGETGGIGRFDRKFLRSIE